jgi:hypothetical protein
MKVAFETRGPADEPYLKLNEEHIVGMTLRAGSMEIGLRRSDLRPHSGSPVSDAKKSQSLL